jgi:hypothetical protein
MFADGRCQLVVAVSGERNRGRGVKDLHSRRCQRQNLQGDSRGVHVRYATLADILQPLDGRSLAAVIHSDGYVS